MNGVTVWANGSIVPLGLSKATFPNTANMCFT